MNKKIKLAINKNLNKDKAISFLIGVLNVSYMVRKMFFRAFIKNSLFLETFYTFLF